jgi:hypothetical protein
LCFQLPLWDDAKAIVLRYTMRLPRKRQVCVTRARVLEYIKSSNVPLDTKQIAEALSTEDALIPERSVRAAVTWLILSDFLIKSEKPIIRRANGQPYKVWLYIWTGKDTPIREVRRNPDERAAQSWGETNGAGVFLQNLFLRMK